MTLPSVASTPPGYLLHRDDMVEYRSAYARAEQDWRHPCASPLPATELPPAWITTCGADPPHDDGRADTDAWGAAGVPVTHRHPAGRVHPSTAAAHERAAGLRRALHR